MVRAERSAATLYVSQLEPQNRNGYPHDFVLAPNIIGSNRPEFLLQTRDVFFE